MDDAFPGALVVDYQHHIEQLILPDAGHRHVLAAAIAGRVDIIVTENVRDFPVEELAKHHQTRLTPDEFVVRLISLGKDRVWQSIQEILNRPIRFGRDQLLDVLRRQGLPRSVELLKEYSG